MLDAHLPQDPNGKGLGNRGRLVWMHHVDLSPQTLHQNPYRTPPSLASHHRGAAQKTIPSDDLRTIVPLIYSGVRALSQRYARGHLWAAGSLIRMSGVQLPKRNVFGNLKSAVLRRWGGEEKEWSDCVQVDVRAFGITEDWKATALEAEVWIETVTEGVRRVMVTWRK